MLLGSESIHMWVWAMQHPFLFTAICLGTPSVAVLIMYLASKILYKSSRRR